MAPAAEGQGRLIPGTGKARRRAASSLPPQQRRDSAPTAARLWPAIDALPEKLRLVIVLAASDGHWRKDVAALLGMPEGTVKSRLFEAKKQLQ